MTTASQVLSGALKQLLVEAEDAPLEPDDYADALFAMNNYMAELAASGTELGYTTVANVADTITVPPGAILGLISNVAVVIAPIYGAPVPPALAQSAARGSRTLRKIGRKKGIRSFPDTLPIGSGNADIGTTLDDRFYGRGVMAILTLTGNTFETEIETAATPVGITAHWIQQEVVGMLADITGRVVSVYDGEVSTTPVVTLSATGTGACTFYIYKNGASLTSTAATLSGTATAVSLTTSTTMKSGDELTLWVAVDGTTDNVTVLSGRIEVR